MQEIWKNLTNGIRQYCRNNGFEDVVLGLSGGLNSAVTAIAAMDALGAEHVHALMMYTKNTSSLSLQIARKIASMNKLNFKEINIQPDVDNMEKSLELIMDAPLKNIVRENLQARIRGLILMAESNQDGYLLLACGNKSEIAMGYCTLYGDTCGGLAPIGELYKSQIFELAKWCNEQCQALPMEVIIRAPSAELSANQKDEDTLPPYKVLDKILELYLDRHLSAAEIAIEGYDAVTTEWIIKRYQSQAFKRQQLPPTIKL